MVAGGDWTHPHAIGVACRRCGWDVSEHQTISMRPRPESDCIAFVPTSNDRANGATRPRGRPPLADKRKPRGGFNDAEWAEVKRKAKDEGMTASAWVRARCGLGMRIR